MVRRMFALAACALTVACAEVVGPGDPSLSEDGAQLQVGEVTLEVNGTTFRHGSTIEVRLVNRGSHPNGYNLCTSAREKEIAGGWQRIEWLRICTAALYMLNPGETATSTEEIDSSWGTGRFRMVTPLYLHGTDGRSFIASETFEVTR